MLHIKNLSISVNSGGRELDVVKNLELSINKGEVVALVGESGSGKSITANSILRLLDDSVVQYKSGSIDFEGEDLLKASEKKMRQIRGADISMIFQEPMTALNPLHTIGRQIAEVITIHQEDNPDENTKKKLTSRVKKLLHQVALDDIAERLNAYPHELSGGQRQRVMIAMAIANNPHLLIADEPTTALDVTTQSQILDLLGDLRVKTNMAILLITHDLGVVKRIADRVYVMKAGEIVESGDTDDIFNFAQHKYTKLLLKAGADGRADPKTVGVEEVLTCRDLTVKFPKKSAEFLKPKQFTTALKNINLYIREGETLGIVGESGSGKSTLGFSLLNLVANMEGLVVVAGSTLSGLRGKALKAARRNAQMVFQDPFSSLNPRMSVFQIVSEGLRVHKLSLEEGEIVASVTETLAEVGLNESFMGRYPHELSGGQRQRVSLARAIILKPKLIILDEPTSALDVLTQAQIIKILRRLQQNYGISFIFISHDLKVITAISHRIMVLKNGKIIEEGATEQIIKKPANDYTKALFEAAYL
jgi:microcin C transport system ATP-binding protein